MVLKTIPLGVGLPIADGVKFINDAIDRSNTVQNQLDTIIIESGTSDAEVIQARGEYQVLNDRMDATTSQLVDTSETLNARLDAKIIESGAANAEVTDARISTVKNKTFTTIRNRMEAIELVTYFPITNRATNGNFANGLTGYTVSGGVGTVENNTLTVTASGSSSFSRVNHALTNPTALQNHTIYAAAIVTPRSSDILSVDIQLTTNAGILVGVLKETLTSGTPQKLSTIINVQNADITIANLQLSNQYSSATVAAGKVVEAENVMMIDLTELFGEGKEPTIDDLESLLSKFPSGWFDGTTNLYRFADMHRHERILNDAASSTVKKTDFADVSDRIEPIERDTFFPVSNIVENGNFNDMTGYTLNNATATTTNNELTLLGTTGNYSRLNQSLSNPANLRNRKMYVSAIITPTTSELAYIALRVTTSVGVLALPSVSKPLDGTPYKIEGILQTQDIAFSIFVLQVVQQFPGGVDISGKGIKIKKLIAIDLTETFGQGEEPTVSEVKSLLSKFPSGWFDGRENLINFSDILRHEKQLNVATAKTKNTSIVIAAVNSPSKYKLDADYVCTGTNDQTVIQSAINALSTNGGKVLMLEGDYIKGNATGIKVPSHVEIEMRSGVWFKLADNINIDASFFANTNKVSGNTNIQIHGGGEVDCNFKNQTLGTYQMFADFENVSNSKIDLYMTNFTMLEVKAKTSRIEVINRKFLQKPKLLSACETLSDFTVKKGVVTLGSTSSPVGDNYVTLTATAANNFEVRLDLVLPTDVDKNFEAYEVEMWIKVDNPDVISRMSLGALSGSGAGVIPIILYTKEVKKMFEPNKWLKIRVPMNRYVLEGVSVWRAYIQTSTESSIHIAQIKAVPGALKPAISFQFDDARAFIGESVIPAFKMFEKYGHRAAIGQMGKDWVGENGYGTYLTIEEIDLAHFEYGWDIYTHTFIKLNEVTTEEAISIVSDSKKFIESNGWKGSQYLVLAAHESTGAVTSKLKKVISELRNPCSEYPITRIGRLSVCRDAPTAQPSELEKAVMRRHIWWCPYSHAVGGTQISFETMESWLSYWTDWGLLSTPPSEIMSEYNSRYNMLNVITTPTT